MYKKLVLGLFLLMSFFGQKSYSFWSSDFCQGFFVSGEYLYWKGKEDGLTYAVSGISTNTEGRTRDLKWRWHSGFKVGAGYVSPCNKWDLFLNYTSFNTSAKDSIDEPGFFSTYLLFPVFTGVFATANSNWHLKYKTLDLTLGSEFFLCPSFSFHPYGGVRAAWTSDHFNIFYVRIAPFAQDIHFDQKFGGIGPRVGSDLNWYFCRNWRICVDGSLNLLWGHYTIYNASNTISTVIEPVFTSTKQKFETLRALADLSIGLGWDHCFCNRYRLSLLLAWENRLWFKHNQFLRFVDTPVVGQGISLNNDTDLTLFGLTLKARLGF